MVQKLNEQQLGKIIDSVITAFFRLLKSIYFEEGHAECICGSISAKIHRYLRRTLGVDAYFHTGTYRGRGSRFSCGDDRGTGHCWVEFNFKFPRKSKPKTVIIDGAYAQFFPSITPQVF